MLGENVDLTNNEQDSLNPWVKELIEWAYKHDINDLLKICRDKSYESVEKALLNLNKLDLSNREIVDLPDSILNLVNLKSLTMANTAMKSFPSIVTELTRLEHLDLSHNQLRELPLEITKITSLKLLDISWNHIVPLPEYLCSIKKVHSAWNRK